MPRKRQTSGVGSSAALDALVRAITKKFGAESITRLGDSYEEVPAVLPTGLAGLDAAIGVGGLPLGKLIELYGAESTGKTTLCKWLAVQAQRAGYTCYFIDTEASVDTDPEFDRKLGLDPTKLLISRPPQVETLEDVFGHLESAIKALKGETALLLWDSVAGTPARVELDTPLDENARPGVRAAFLARALPRLLVGLKGSKVGVVFVNQVRERIGALQYQEKTYSPGGRAFRHYCHLRLEMHRVGSLKQGTEDIGIRTRVKVKKSKVAPPLKEAVFRIFFEGRIEDGEG